MITLEKAKEILDDTAKDMSDEQIIETVDHMYRLADFIIDSYLEMSPEQRRKFSRNKGKSKFDKKQKH